METLVAATKGGAELMMMAEELGQIKEGFLADLLIVDGDPLDDITLFQDEQKLLAIMKDGDIIKNETWRRTATRDDVASGAVTV
jgi:imidazolonepropionase-like amidohydrolase